MRRPRGMTLVVTAGAVALLAISLSACTGSPSSVITVDDVILERAQAVEATERAQFDDFLQQSSRRFTELGLPLPAFQGVVPLDEWDASVSECVVGLAPQLDASRFDGRVTVNYFGIVGEPYERTRWVLEGCIAQFGVADPRAMPAPGAVERAWWYRDATQRVVPCLRGIGALVPSPPSAREYDERWGTESRWNPYVFIDTNPAALTRALALCPPSGVVLAAATGATPGEQSGQQPGETSQ